MNGKGDRSRVSNWDAFSDNYDSVFRPKEPFCSDIKEYERRFMGDGIGVKPKEDDESLEDDKLE
jgi:hypothetical protein